MKIWRKRLTSYEFGYAASVTAAVFFAGLVGMIFPWDTRGWMVLTAFFVSQTTSGTPSRQTFFSSMVLIFAVLAGGALTASQVHAQILWTVVDILFLVCAYFYWTNQKNGDRRVSFLIYFLTFLMVALPSLMAGAILRDLLISVIAGAAIGIACRLLIFPINFAKMFRHDLNPILVQMQIYTKALTHYLKNQETSEQLLKEKYALEKLLSQGNRYPEWVYEAGFNPGLRSGFRFFLIYLEHVIELFFSFSYFVLRNEKSLFEGLSPLLVNVLNRNLELLTVLDHNLQDEQVPLPPSASDYVEDVTMLEEWVSAHVPNQLELLEIEPRYLVYIEVVRDMKEMRQLLLQLLMALPAPNQPLTAQK